MVTETRRKEFFDSETGQDPGNHWPKGELRVPYLPRKPYLCEGVGEDSPHQSKGVALMQHGVKQVGLDNPSGISGGEAFVPLHSDLQIYNFHPVNHPKN